MQTTIVDRVAMALPWVGGLVPATMTGHNAYTVLGFELWQAVLIAVVVEAIGFVTITTTLDLWEMLQNTGADWNAPRISSGLFWVGLAGTLVYLFVVVSINALLDNGDALAKTTKGLMASFGLLGGLMVALRNQMAKSLETANQARIRKDESDAEARTRQDEIEREKRAFELQMEKEKRQFELQMEAEKLRQAHELKLKKIEEKARKVSETSTNDKESFQKVADDGQKVPETFGKWHDWRKLPESEKKVIAKLESPEKVSELYGVPLKTSGNWLANAKKLYPMEEQ